MAVDHKGDWIFNVLGVEHRSSANTVPIIGIARFDGRNRRGLLNWQRRAKEAT